MGLAIDGNVVHGIAKGGQAFVSLENTNADGSINIGGQDYLSKNKMKLEDTGVFEIGFYIDGGGKETDITSNLSNYKGCLAICLIQKNYSLAKSQPIIIPTVSTTENLSFDGDNWGGSLSMTTDNKFKFVPYFKYADVNTDATGNFWILSNKTS